MTVLAFGEPVVVLRRGESPGVDRYGNPLPGPVVEVDVGSAAFDPGGSREPVEVGRASVVTNPKLYFLDADPGLSAADTVRVRGDVYRVQGRPAVWVSPFTGALEGAVVELELVEG